MSIREVETIGTIELAEVIGENHKKLSNKFDLMRLNMEPGLTTHRIFHDGNNERCCEFFFDLDVAEYLALTYGPYERMLLIKHLKNKAR